MKWLSELESRSQQVAKILKLIAHPKRLLILCRLVLKSETVGELEKQCGISQSQLSQFLSRMQAEWILTSQKSGQFVSYSIGDPKVKRLLEALSAIYC